MQLIQRYYSCKLTDNQLHSTTNLFTWAVVQVSFDNSWLKIVNDMCLRHLHIHT